jgi:2-dehydro-3-deoxyphosphogluconate aldolase/(4S)-4-hydroxy-2-oxoglutarate aldolase
MTKEEVLRRIRDVGLVAVIRLADEGRLDEVVGALGSAGATIIEITTTVPGAIESISRYVKEFGEDYIFGCGTVTDRKTAARAMDAGADFVVSPVLQEPMVEEARSRGVLAIPAAFTPTEILHADEIGAGAVKLFPARSLGPSYVRDILGPLPGIQIIPAGGVDAGNAGSYIKAGAVAVFSGSSIVSDRKLREEGPEGVEKSAREMMSSISEARRDID